MNYFTVFQNADFYGFDSNGKMQYLFQVLDYSKALKWKLFEKLASSNKFES